MDNAKHFTCPSSDPINACFGELSSPARLFPRLRKCKGSPLLDVQIDNDHAGDGASEAEVATTTVTMNSQHSGLGTARLHLKVQAITNEVPAGLPMLDFPNRQHLSVPTFVPTVGIRFGRICTATDERELI